MNVFRFAHLSVREYLESKEGYEASLNHETAAFSCLSYLTESPRTDRHTFSRFKYAYFGWALHSASSGKRRLQGRLHDLFRIFLGDLRNPSSFLVGWAEEFQGRYDERGWETFNPRVYSMHSNPINPIFAASVWGFSEILETEADFDPDIFDKTNYTGHTALVVSTRYEQYDMVRLLLLNKVSVESKGDDKNTALHIASTYDRKILVRMLLDYGAIIETRNQSKNTPLISSSKKGHTEIVQMLIQKGADVDAKNIMRETSLHLASENGHKKIVELLLKRGANPDTYNGRSETPLHVALWGGYEEVAQMLLEGGIDICTKNTISETPLSLASGKGYEGIVRAMLEKGADVNPQHGPGEVPIPTALAAACTTGNEDLVRLLIDYGANIDCRDMWHGSALIGAAEHGSLTNLRLLCEAEAHVNFDVGLRDPKEYPSALSAAAHKGYKDKVQLLLNFGANVNARCDAWKCGTVLIAAAGKGHNEIISLLLASGADVNLGSVDWKYTNAIVAATKKGHKAAVQLLLRKGARLDDQDLKNRETLTTVIELGNEELVQALLDYGVNVHVKDSHGWAPYHVAYANGYNSICDVLSVATPIVANQHQEYGIRPDRWVVAKGSLLIRMHQNGLLVGASYVVFWVKPMSLC